jgi:hypothetical protein
MKSIDRRLRRLEVGLLPPPETDDSRCFHEAVQEILRRRAERLGLSEPENIPARSFRPEMSIAEKIIASQLRRPLTEAET